MSALVRYFLQKGLPVAGYDRYRSPLCEMLEKEGAELHYHDDPAAIPAAWTAAETTVVYTPAISSDLLERQHLEAQGYRLVKRAELLGEIARSHRCLAVAGTHGKTTTSALLAHLFRQAEVPITAFLGGISSNYQSNFWTAEGADLVVVEADEFDRSFLRLAPHGAVVTSMDADHLDIYGDAASLSATFVEFARSVSHFLLAHERLDLPVQASYGGGEQASYRWENLRIAEQAYHFDLQHPEGLLRDLSFRLPGRHNLENAVAASALALHYGLSEEQLRQGLASFKGVKRRFEYQIKRPDLHYIDDYAHHPQELEAVAQALADFYPEQPTTVIFQPHLFSRTRDFMAEFAAALSRFDEVLLLDIYPAREKPIPGVSAAVLLDAIEAPRKALVDRQSLLIRFSTERPPLILTLGAGDIDQLVHPLKMALSR